MGFSLATAVFLLSEEFQAWQSDELSRAFICDKLFQHPEAGWGRDIGLTYAAQGNFAEGSRSPTQWPSSLDAESGEDDAMAGLKKPYPMQVQPVPSAKGERGGFAESPPKKTLPQPYFCPAQKPVETLAETPFMLLLFVRGVEARQAVARIVRKLQGIRERNKVANAEKVRYERPGILNDAVTMGVHDALGDVGACYLQGPYPL